MKYQRFNIGETSDLRVLQCLQCQLHPNPILSPSIILSLPSKKAGASILMQLAHDVSEKCAAQYNIMKPRIRGKSSSSLDTCCLFPISSKPNTARTPISFPPITRSPSSSSASHQTHPLAFPSLSPISLSPIPPPPRNSSHKTATGASAAPPAVRKAFWMEAGLIP